MEFYGHSGDLLRRKQTIINLHVELNEWRTQMEAHPGDSEAANVFLARAREQLEADAMLEKAKAAAPLPGSAPKDGNSDCASTTAIRTALPQKRRPRVVTRKLPQIFPHMDYPEDQHEEAGAAATTGRGKAGGDAKGARPGTMKKNNNNKKKDGDTAGQDKSTKTKACLCC
jgi:hypothetical protein